MFIVLETQTYNDGSVGTLIDSYSDENQAKSKYHAILSAAAVSAVPRHSAFILRDDGYMMQSECYRHEEEVTE